MLSIIRNRYFQRIFLCYFLVILCLLSSFGGYLLASSQRREAEIQRANLENEARILAQVMDEKFNTLSDTCVQLLGDTQIEKVSSSSEIIHSSLDIFDRRSICEMLRHYMYMSGMVSSMALLMPQKHEAIDAYSFWDSEERYFQSIGVSQAGFKDELYAAVAESYGSLVLLPLENSRDVAVGRCIDAFSAPRQVFFFRISQTYFSGMLRSHLRSGDYSVELLREGETLLRAGRSDANLPQVVVDSALFGWSYRIALPVAESAPFPMWATLLLAFVLLVLALCAGLLISYFTYQPVMQMLARLGILHSAGDEFSAVKRRFEEIRQSEIEMEGLTSQYYNSARNNLLLSLLHGAFARRLTNDAMALFGLPFEQSDGKLYVAVVVTDEGERPEEETARDLLRMQNYLVLSRIPAVKCVAPEGELILILYCDDSGRADAVKRLSRLVLQLKAYCRDSFAGYECFSGLPHHGLMGISKSYQEALEERIDGETGCQAGYYFPLDWEIQLITQLRAGNARALERILRELSRENLARSLNASEHRQLMSMLAEILQRVARETNAGLKDFSSRLAAAADLEDRQAAWEAMGRLARELCPAAEEIDGAQPTGERIRQYLHEHFRDANLSQKGIADEFGLSCPNMSRMFKRTTGKNFIDYLQELRVFAARSAFDAGETDVIAVARSCGYENEVTFRRAFFRVYAISPHQYVSQLGEENE